MLQNGWFFELFELFFLIHYLAKCCIFCSDWSTALRHLICIKQQSKSTPKRNETTFNIYKIGDSVQNKELLAVEIYQEEYKPNTFDKVKHTVAKIFFLVSRNLVENQNLLQSRPINRYVLRIFF